MKMIMLLIIKYFYDSLIKIINSETDDNFLSINYELVFLSSNADRIKKLGVIILEGKILGENRKFNLYYHS